MHKEQNTEAQKSEVLQGTLDLMNEGTVYTSPLRLQQREWIASDCGTSENNHKAKYYSITKSGRKQLAHETENWERIAGVIGRLLKLEGQG
jgi:PadR family transcriptional regulator